MREHGAAFFVLGNRKGFKNRFLSGVAGFQPIKNNAHTELKRKVVFSCKMKIDH